LQDEIQKLPANPAAEVKKSRECWEQLSELAQAAPPLARLAEVRHELADAVRREHKAGEVRQEVEARGKKLKAEVEQLTTEVNAAAAARQQADEQATRARTLRDQAKDQLQELMQLSGAKVCRHCGQELTAGHIQEEKVRRERELQQADAEHHNAIRKQQS